MQQLQLLTEPRPEGNDDKSFLALNDDCLIAIFKQLDTNNLYSSAVSCKRFLNIAKIVFKKHFVTFERIDEKILRVFGDKITDITIKLRTYGSHPHPQFSEINLRKTIEIIDKYCTNRNSCRIKLSKSDYSDFKNTPHGANWYTIGFLDHNINRDNNDHNLSFDINSVQNLNEFIRNFDKYLRQHIQVEHDRINSNNGYYEDVHNNSDIAKANKAVSIYDLTSEDQMRLLGSNLTHVNVKFLEYYFDLEKISHALDQFETIRILQKHCQNIVNLKVQIVDANIFRMETFHKLLQRAKKLDLTMLIRQMDNFDNIANCILRSMNSCVQLKTLTLHVSTTPSCKYLKPFLIASYANLKKITVYNTELYDENLINNFSVINRNVGVINLCSKIEK